jgi:hypothetical protein
LKQTRPRQAQALCIIISCKIHHKKNKPPDP